EGVFTNAAGEYTLTGLNSGDYRVNFSDSSQNLVGEYWNNQASYQDATILAVARGAVITGIDAELAEGATVSGTVKDVDGNPIEGVEVNAAGNFGSSAVTNASGMYTIGGLRA